MTTPEYVCWLDGEMWLGYLLEYPNYWTQGESQGELEENLKDISDELTDGNVLGVR